MIVVAHRLSTVKNFERVIYMDSGQILAQGTFNEVRELVKNFDIQASKLGL